MCAADVHLSHGAQPRAPNHFLAVFCSTAVEFARAEETTGNIIGIRMSVAAVAAEEKFASLCF